MFSFLKKPQLSDLVLPAQLSSRNTIGGLPGAEVLQAQGLHSAVSALSTICQTLADEGVRCSEMLELRDQSWHLLGAVASVYAPDLLKDYHANASVQKGASLGKLIGEGYFPRAVIERNYPESDIDNIRTALAEVGELSNTLTDKAISLVTQRRIFLCDWDYDEVLSLLKEPSVSIAKTDLPRLLDNIAYIADSDKLQEDTARYFLGALINTEDPDLTCAIIDAQLHCLSAYRPSQSLCNKIKRSFQTACRDNNDLLEEVRDLWPGLNLDDRMDFLRYWIDITRVHLSDNMKAVPVRYSGECDKSSAAHFTPTFNTGVAGYIEFNESMLSKMTFDQAMQVASHELTHAYTFHLMAHDFMSFRQDVEWLALALKSHDYIKEHLDPRKHQGYLNKKYEVCPHEVISFGLQDTVAQFLLELGAINSITPLRNLAN